VLLETTKISVEGMTCGNCARAIERKLSTRPGVTKAQVDLAGSLATVEFDANRTQLFDLVTAIQQLGYRVRP
jgi:Cu+-exporting ATPase